jgi:hypothetical protein
MIFEYNAQMVFMNQLEVEDIGNFALRGVSDDFAEYYFITKTSLGKTHILKFGPCIPDIDQLVEDFSVAYKKIDYKEATIKTELKKFINDGKKGITNAEILDLEEALSCFPKVTEIYMELY